MTNRAKKAQHPSSETSAPAAEEVPVNLPTGVERNTGERNTGEADEELFTLSLSDLIQDANGEIVLFNDSHLRRLALLTEAHELARGEAPHHITATGEDVTGFRYVTFDNGVTLYYQPDLELLVVHERG